MDAEPLWDLWARNLLEEERSINYIKFSFPLLFFRWLFVGYLGGVYVCVCIFLVVCFECLRWMTGNKGKRHLLMGWALSWELRNLSTLLGSTHKPHVKSWVKQVIFSFFPHHLNPTSYVFRCIISLCEDQGLISKVPNIPQHFSFSSFVSEFDFFTFPFHTQYFGPMLVSLIHSSDK